jgi:antitoxin MazE
MKTVRTRVVRIGNSRGVRIPKPLLDQSGLGEEVELQVEKNRIIIRPSQEPRAGWDEQFRRMAELGDDRLLDADVPSLTSWDEDEWEW